MTHPETTEFQRWLDGELSRRRAQKVDGHVQSCGSCRQAVQELQTTSDLLRFALHERADDPALAGLADQVIAAVESQERLPWWESWRTWLAEVAQYQRRLWLPPLAVGTAAAVALVAVTFFSSHAPPAGVELTAPEEVASASLGTAAPPQSEVISVSFGDAVQGTLFQIEDEDGSRTAVIWVDGSAMDSITDDSEAKRWPVGRESTRTKTS
jgi:anti-sigma factor RsiW